MEKRNVLQTGLALAITLVLVNLVCAAAVAIWPDRSIEFANAFAHGLDFTPIKSAKGIAARTLVYGVIGLALLGFAIGALYARVFNLLRDVGKADRPKRRT